MKRSPGDPATHFDLGRLYADKGRASRAVVEWRHAVELDPSFCPAHFELARAAEGEGDRATAADRCRAYLKCVEDVPAPTAPPDDAIAYCRELVSRSP